MRLTTVEPSVVPSLQSVTFHCDSCSSETKREIKIDKQTGALQPSARSEN
jgi:hypothetical protein